MPICRVGASIQTLQRYRHITVYQSYLLTEVALYFVFAFGNCLRIFPQRKKVADRPWWNHTGHSVFVFAEIDSLVVLEAQMDEERLVWLFPLELMFSPTFTDPANVFCVMSSTVFTRVNSSSEWVRLIRPSRNQESQTVDVSVITLEMKTVDSLVLFKTFSDYLTFLLIERIIG